MQRHPVPYAFEQFTAKFYDGVIEDFSNETAVLDWLATGFTLERRIEVRDFIRTILTDGSTDVDLAEIWLSGESPYYVEIPSARAFFQALLDALNRNLPEP